MCFLLPTALISLESNCILFISLPFMRVFAFIMSLYMLCIACLPCNDMHDDALTTTSGQQQLAPNDHHDHDHEHSLDFCSPFCVCSCCSVHLIPLSASKISFLQLAFFSQEHALQNVSLSSLTLSPIWQPPQIG